MNNVGGDDSFWQGIVGFEQTCLESADPMFFREPSLFLSDHFLGFRWTFGRAPGFLAVKAENN